MDFSEYLSSSVISSMINSLMISKAVFSTYLFTYHREIFGSDKELIRIERETERTFTFDLDSNSINRLNKRSPCLNIVLFLDIQYVSKLPSNS